MNGMKMHCAECNKQSLLNTLNTFVEEVNAMNDRVMVPSRLRDMNFAETNTTETNNNNSSMSVLPVSGTIGCQGENLYSYYAMINAVKNEILSGHGHTHPDLADEKMTSENDMDASSSTSSSDNESDDGINDAARKTAEAFRHHLQGLFGLLHQLTDTAKTLGNTYEDQIGGSRKLRKFMI